MAQEISEEGRAVDKYIFMEEVEMEGRSQQIEYIPFMKRYVYLCLLTMVIIHVIPSFWSFTCIL